MDVPSRDVSASSGEEAGVGDGPTSSGVNCLR